MTTSQLADYAESIVRANLAERLRLRQVEDGLRRRETENRADYSEPQWSQVMEARQTFDTAAPMLPDDWTPIDDLGGPPFSADSATRPPEPRAERSSSLPLRRELPNLEPGDLVRHDKFGQGTVVSIAGVGDKSEATIDFGTEGTKRLLLRYSPLTPIGDQPPDPG